MTIRKNLKRHRNTPFLFQFISYICCMSRIHQPLKIVCKTNRYQYRGLELTEFGLTPGKTYFPQGPITGVGNSSDLFYHIINDHNKLAYYHISYFEYFK